MGSQSKTVVGAGLKIYINNRPFGIGTAIEWVSNNSKEEVFGVDQLTPFEIEPTRNSISGSIECTKVRNDGGLEGRGITASDTNTLLEKYISIYVVDRLSGAVIFKCQNALVTNQKWRVDGRGMVKGSFGFSGLNWTGESEV